MAAKLRKRSAIVASMLLIAIAGFGSGYAIQHEAYSFEALALREAGEMGDALEKERERSLDEISLREANAFHLAVLERTLHRELFPHELTVRYGGIISEVGPKWEKRGGLPRKEGGVTQGDIGDALSWSLADERGRAVLSWWLSVGRTAETVASVPVLGRSFFVNVPDVQKRRKELEAKRPEFGGRSALQVIRLLGMPATN